MRPAYLVCVLAIGACSAEDDRLVAASQVTDDRLEQPLTDIPGDMKRGETIFAERERGHCVLCHVVDGLDVPFQGNLGPNLTELATRLEPAQIRLRIVDYEIVQPGVTMPSYFRIHDLHQVRDEYTDQPVLTAQEVEDLVAYLGSLDGNIDDG